DPQYDKLAGAGLCGTQKPAPVQDRCGYGPRMPLLVISPYAKANYVDHATTDQTSILKFIEDNWGTGANPDATAFDHKAGSLNGMFDFSGRLTNTLTLDPSTGQPTG
ncbi:MAG: phospholipase, partial [Solirubrobacteraceae bacterium]|nr:phospholipase [Solirubrobacteraceae bacterium]